ncbi:STAS domain-containing protein [Nonomuraea sp. NPDC050310]|uniref:STAS domain-containing protein n=1 Tax=unclassified Nonomuraea TaxID=2593643 RepID=UPI00340FFB61
MLRIEVGNPDTTTVRLALSGDLDFTSVSELSDLTLADGLHRLDVDLSGLDFIDSSGLAALIRLYHQAEEAHAVFQVTALTPYLRHLLHTTALDRLFRLPPA